MITGLLHLATLKVLWGPPNPQSSVVAFPFSTDGKQLASASVPYTDVLHVRRVVKCRLQPESLPQLGSSPYFLPAVRLVRPQAHARDLSTRKAFVLGALALSEAAIPFEFHCVCERHRRPGRAPTPTPWPTIPGACAADERFRTHASILPAPPLN